MLLGWHQWEAAECSGYKLRALTVEAWVQNLPSLRLSFIFVNLEPSLQKYIFLSFQAKEARFQLDFEGQEDWVTSYVGNE